MKLNPWKTCILQTMTYLLTKIFNRLVGSISAARVSGPVEFQRLISQTGAESYGQTGNKNLQLVLLRNELKNNFVQVA